MKIAEVGYRVIIILMIISLLGVVVFAMATILDAMTIEKVGVEKVPCIDKLGNPFEDELCEDTIYCSKLGLAGDRKCSDGFNVNQERKE